MRLEGNPLDLNSLPEEHGKHPLEESSLTAAASADITRSKKTKGAVKDDSAKVYECRFCSLKFCKSQALGGHMNRHRQERETETLNRARQLVFSNDGAIGLRDPSTGEACLQFHPVYRGLPNPPPPMSQYLHPSSSSSSHSLPPPRCYIGHVVSGSSQRQPPHHGYSPDPSFTRYGAPVSRSFPVEEGRAPAAGRGNQLRSEFRTCPPQLAVLGEPSAPGMALTYTS